MVSNFIFYSACHSFDVEDDDNLSLIKNATCIIAAPVQAKVNTRQENISTINDTRQGTAANEEPLPDISAEGRHRMVCNLQSLMLDERCG